MPLSRLPRWHAWIERQDYDAFKAFSPDDSDLPPSYDEWVKLAEEVEAKMAAGNIAFQRLVIDPKKFAAWCRASGFDANSTTRGMFASVTERCEREGWTIPGTR